MERSNMPEKDPNNTALFVEWLRQFMPYLTTFFLSTWSGVVNHITTLRSGRKKFQLKELIFDLVVRHCRTGSSEMNSENEAVDKVRHCRTGSSEIN